VDDDEDDDMCIINEVRKLQERIRNLQRQRLDELEILSRMTSCPLRKNSFGKYKIFKMQAGGVEDRYNWSIGGLKDRIDKLVHEKNNKDDSGGDDPIGIVIDVRYCARESVHNEEEGRVGHVSNKKLIVVSKPHTNFTQTSHKLHTNITQTSHKHYENFNFTQNSRKLQLNRFTMSFLLDPIINNARHQQCPSSTTNSMLTWRTRPKLIDSLKQRNVNEEDQTTSLTNRLV
jgi:hypothetical protein